ncbi:MAG: hypothetical protein ACTHMX_06860, partial [Thermomicrobiales bacterium]
MGVDRLHLHRERGDTLSVGADDRDITLRAYAHITSVLQRYDDLQTFGNGADLDITDAESGLGGTGYGDEDRHSVSELLDNCRSAFNGSGLCPLGNDG